jgi:hypothetical protein
MTSDNIVPMRSAIQAAPVIIDDSRLQTLWRQQHRRQNWIVGGAVATALLIAGALVVMAFRINGEPPTVNITPPSINVPAPIVNVTPQIEVKLPGIPTPTAQEPAMTPRPGESKVVTEYTQFTTVTVGDFEVWTGWAFRNSKDTAPYAQHCYTLVGRTGRLDLARMGVISASIDMDARAVGLDPGVAETLAKSCRWSTQELRDPANR